MNTTDKYVLTHKVKRPLSYAIVAGVVNLFIGIVVALCLNWSGVTSYREILFPALAGAIFGTQFLIYYQLLSKEDVSTVIGLLYLYPIVVAILSYIFLAEKFTLLTYIGMGLIMFGGVRLSGRVAVFNIRFGLLIAMLILLVALHEFFIKVATNSLPAINGLSISMITMGLTI
ncbi:MAG: EamA family transporter, partial [Deltaproteobacteria bacterium]